MATLNQSDQQVWKKVLAAKNQCMTQAQIQQSIPGMAHRELTMSLTQLIDLQLLKVESKEGQTIYHGIKPKDAKKSKASLTSEQSLVLSLVKAAHNRGVSQKALRGQIGADTIPTTVLRKTLETLEKGDFIKSFRSIHQPTIALYISPHVKPAEELTGGVWYDGQKEYDADFVNGITTFLYEKVKSATFPANDLRNPAHVKLVSKAIYPIARTKKLPTPYTLLQALKKSNLTQVKMKISNIMECMRALELDGLVEAIKPIGGVEVPDIMGESDDEGPLKRKRKADESETDEDERERQKEMAKEIAKDRKKKEKLKERKKLKAERAEKRVKEKEREKEKKAKRLEREKEKEREKARRRKEKRKKMHKSIAESSDSDNGDESDELVALDEEPRRKENKRRRVASDDESEDDRRSRRSSRKRKGKYREDTESEESDSDSEDQRRRKKDKSKKRRRSKYSEAESETETESEPESDSDVSVSSVDSDELDLHDIALKPKSTAAAVDTSDLQTVAFARTGLGELTDYHVAYRATNLVNLPLGQTQISCGKCPQFNFCQEGGPVDPDSCAYIDDWLADVVGGWDPEARRRYQEEAAPQIQDDLNGGLEQDDEDEDEAMSVA